MSPAQKRRAGIGRWLAALAALILVTACGYRGPLYLPQDEPGGPRAQAPAGDDPEAAADQDDEEDDDDDGEDGDQERGPSR